MLEMENLKIAICRPRVTYRKAFATVDTCKFYQPKSKILLLLLFGREIQDFISDVIEMFIKIY